MVLLRQHEVKVYNPHTWLRWCSSDDGKFDVSVYLGTGQDIKRIGGGCRRATTQQQNCYLRIGARRSTARARQHDIADHTISTFLLWWWAARLELGGLFGGWGLVLGLLMQRESGL